MKNIKLLSIILLVSFPVLAQDTQQYFNNGANQYIAGNLEQARSTVMDGLRRDPDNQKLRELLKKINQQEDQNQQNQQQQDQQNQDQQQEEQNQQEEQEQQQQQEDQQQQDEQQSGEDQQEAEQSEEQKEQDDREQQTKQQENEQQAALDSLFQMQEEQMKISPEKARMILEALRNNEIQYYQQRRRKPTQRPDRSKPDW